MRNETLGVSTDNLPVSPSAERNKGPIAGILKRVLPDHGTVLEISSGTGQHVVHFAREMPDLTWQPSERDAPSLQSIERWMAAENLPNILAPLRIDVTELPWPAGNAAAIVCLNMIHIAPWPAAEGLIQGAKSVLGQGGILFLYGPYRRQGRPTAPSNETFDEQLRSRNLEWGLRNVEDVARYAMLHGFDPPEIHEMPANNLSLVFRRQ
jgi:SAM-dependent methyltransferase